MKLDLQATRDPQPFIDSDICEKVLVFGDTYPRGRGGIAFFEYNDDVFQI